MLRMASVFSSSLTSQSVAEPGTEYWTPVFDLELPPSDDVALLWLALILAGELQ